MISFAKKYFYPGRSISFYVATICLALIFCVIGYYSKLQYSFLQIHFLVNSQQSATFDIYYDIGRGLSEKDRQSRTIEQTNLDTEITFSIPIYHRLKLLRFDPARGFASMTIKKIEYSYDGVQTKLVSLENVKPINEIQSHSISNGVLQFTTVPEGVDPGFVIDSDLSPPEKTFFSTKAGKIMYYFKYLISSIATAFFLRFIYLFFFRGL